MARQDVVILLDDFAGAQGKSCFWVCRSWQQAGFFAALHGLSAARGPELVKSARAVRFYGVLGNEELSCDLTIA
jgi:hypothetical protein